MDVRSELIAALRDNLQAWGYGQQAEGDVGGADCAAAISAPKRSSVKFACAVARIPQHVRGAVEAERFVGGIRRGLAKRYAGFPWLNRLGTFTVLLVSRELFEELLGQECRFIDQGGWHVNVMIGTVLVDVDTFRTRSENTWGLLGDGEHFVRIRDAVEQWCSRYRKPDRTVWGRRPAVGVA